MFEFSWAAAEEGKGMGSSLVCAGWEEKTCY